MCVCVQSRAGRRPRHHHKQRNENERRGDGHLWAKEAGAECYYNKSWVVPDGIHMEPIEYHLWSDGELHVVHRTASWAGGEVFFECFFCIPANADSQSGRMKIIKARLIINRARWYKYIFDKIKQATTNFFSEWEGYVPKSYPQKKQFVP